MISINRVDGLIGISTTNAKLYISQPPPEFEINTELPRIEMDSEMVKIEISQRQCFNEAGLMDNTTLAADISQRGQQALFEAIDRMVSEGNMMAAVESGQDNIAEISRSNSIQLIDFNVDFIPKSRPVINIVGGTVDIRVQEGKVSIYSKPRQPILESEPGSVTISMRQYPSIEIKFIGSNVDTQV